MENPNTWGEAERIVDDCLRYVDSRTEMTGLSVVRQITDALRAAGLLMSEKPYPQQFYPGCPCYACDAPTWPEGIGPARMSLCPRCGNKRCPGAANHTNVCTGSNEPGQPGSLYE